MSAKHAEFVAGLRAVADFYEAHPDCPMPYEPDVTVTHFEEESPEEAARVGRMLGRFEKDYGPDLFTLSRRFNGVRLRFLFYREKVCTKRVVGVEEVPEQVVPAHTREIVEWDCAPILAAGVKEDA